jgi:hypothetical protein
MTTGDRNRFHSSPKWRAKRLEASLGTAFAASFAVAAWLARGRPASTISSRAGHIPTWLWYSATFGRYALSTITRRTERRAAAVAQSAMSASL